MSIPTEILERLKSRKELHSRTESLIDVLTAYGKPLNLYGLLSWEDALAYPVDETCPLCRDCKELLKLSNPQTRAILFDRFHLVGLLH